MIREYPDIRQDAENNCGDAAVSGVFKFLGEWPAPPMATDHDGLHPSTIEGQFRLAGLRVQSGEMTLADLKHHASQMRPVLCPIDVYGGHWVTVLGVTAKRIRFHCPMRGFLWDTPEGFLEVWKDSTRSGHKFTNWGIAVS